MLGMTGRTAMTTLHVDLPESLMLATGQSPEALVREASFLLALKLFEMDRVSSERAAEVCGLSRVEFLLAASRAGVPVADLDETEMEREFEE
jgi:predicted HTH domain antitoxin